MTPPHWTIQRCCSLSKITRNCLFLTTSRFSCTSTTRRRRTITSSGCCHDVDTTNDGTFCHVGLIGRCQFHGRRHRRRFLLPYVPFSSSSSIGPWRLGRNYIQTYQPTSTITLSSSSTTTISSLSLFMSQRCVYFSTEGTSTTTSAAATTAATDHTITPQEGMGEEHNVSEECFPPHDNGSLDDDSATSNNGRNSHPDPHEHPSSPPQLHLLQPKQIQKQQIQKQDTQKQYVQKQQQQQQQQQRFEDLPILHPKTLKALRRQGIHRLTDIQEMTYQPILYGENVVGRSRTGSGKTLAFLIPSIERILLSIQQQEDRNAVVDDDDDDGEQKDDHDDGYHDDDDMTHLRNGETHPEWDDESHRRFMEGRSSTSSIPSSPSPLSLGVQILILVPTRELAVQIGKEADKLLFVHSGGTRSTKDFGPISCQVVYGGSSKEDDIKQFNIRLPTILVATPGRLKDHLATTMVSSSTISQKQGGGNMSTTATTTTAIPFAQCLQNLRTLVLDETDRLLQLGFRKDVQDILASVPRGKHDYRNDPFRKRQTLLFSATMPPSVLDVVDLAMSTDSTTIAGKDVYSSNNNNDNNMKNKKKNYLFVDCIQDDDPTTETNDTTKQSYIVLPNHKFWMGTMELIVDLVEQSERDNNKGNSKIMVFFPMTRLVQLYSNFLTLRLGKQRVWELHGKMDQRQRTVVSRRFRNAPKGVLLTSDVSARGIDYPNVTHVIQVGAAQSRETYIHRLGRTGRAGKEGNGLLILPELEQQFLDELEGLDLYADGTLQKTLSRSRVRKDVEDELGVLARDIRTGHEKIISESVYLAYQSMISYYFQSTDEQQSDRVVSTINQLVQDFGLPELPAIDYERAKKIGIDMVPGLNIQKSWKDHNWYNNGSVGTSSREDVNIRPTAHNGDYFHRKPYGNFDDWFDVPSRTTRQNGREVSSTPTNGRQNSSWKKPNKGNRDDGPTRRTSPFAERRTEEPPMKPARSKKRSTLNFNSSHFQRWEVPGELSKPSK